MAVAFNELMEGATLLTGEKWQGINKIDDMLIELRDQVTQEIPNLVNKRFADTEWMETDRTALLAQLETIYTQYKGRTVTNPDPVAGGTINPTFFQVS